MAQYPMTLGDDVVQHLFVGDGGVARLLEQVLNQVLQAQEAVQAAPYERTTERRGYRNGTVDRPLTTRVGTLTLRVPRLRDGSFSPELFARYQRHEQAFVLARLEMVINGVSTRKVTKITEELCGTEVSKSAVSALCQQLDPVVTAWRTRSWADTPYPFLLVDALVLRIREDGHGRPRAGCVVMGVNAAGQREILGFWVGDSESEAHWRTVCQDLKARGLHGVDLVVSDQHAGLVRALQREFQGTTWQRCQTHFSRNVLDACPKALHDPLHAAVRAVFEAPDRRRADWLSQPLITDFQETAPKAVAIWEAGVEDALAILAYPAEVRLRLRTANDLERLNREIRRRERVIRIVPHRASAERLLGAGRMEVHEGWSTGRRYVNLETYWAERGSAAAEEPAVTA
ncbi:MAG: IS256 family transposase [Clostridia bacterium]